MIYPIKVIDIELSQTINTINGLEGYLGLLGLVRFCGIPIGYLKVPLINGSCKAETISKLIINNFECEISQILLQNDIPYQTESNRLQLLTFLNCSSSEYREDLPLVTVAVCTRDRTPDLVLCLNSINQLDYPNLEVIIVDNSPSSDATRNLIKTQYPSFRYVYEPRPGLDWARNRAIIESKGDIIAFTDDDVVADSGWIKAFVQVFSENQEVMAVTGLVVPFELETKAQVIFENFGGFGRGFKPKWIRIPSGEKIPWNYYSIGMLCGTGANMAYRKCIFEKIGYFNPALDVGTVTNGGGDLEMFFRVIKSNKTLVYEPKAIIRHRHRREYKDLKNQMTNNGSVYSFLVCVAKKYPDERITVFLLGIWWMITWHFNSIFHSLLGKGDLPLELNLMQLKGSIQGLTRYQKACNIAKIIENTYGPL